MRLRPGRKGINTNEILADETWLINQPIEGEFSTVALYPNNYWIAMSNLEYHKLIIRMLESGNLSVERAFYDPEILKPGYSFFTRTQFRKFNITAISLSYELDMLNALICLKSGGIPLLSKERGEDAPFVIFVGAVPTANPEPLADFADIVFIGDLEDGFIDILRKLLNLHRTGIPRMEALKKISTMRGVYIPALYRATYWRDNLSSFHPITGDTPDFIKRACAKTINDDPSKSILITKHTKFSCSFMIEISRGCPYECGFCLYRYANYPPRFIDIGVFEKELQNAKDKLGDKFTHISIIGSAIANHPKFLDILNILLANELNLGLPSSRAELLKPDYLSLLKKLGIHTITIAPEVGDDSLRKKIGKDTTTEEFIEFASNINSLAIPKLKLHFILGLTTKPQDEVDSIITLIERIHTNYKGHITISVNPFTPKAQTPMAFYELPSEKDLKKAFLNLTRAIYRENLGEVKSKSVRQGRIQRLLSLGDRRVSEYLTSSLKSKKLRNVSKEEEKFIPTPDGIKPWDHIRLL